MKTIIAIIAILASTSVFAQNSSPYKTWYNQQSTNNGASTGQQDTNANNTQYNNNQELKKTSCQSYKKFNTYTQQYEYVTVCQ